MSQLGSLARLVSHPRQTSSRTSGWQHRGLIQTPIWESRGLGIPNSYVAHKIHHGTIDGPRPRPGPFPSICIKRTWPQPLTSIDTAQPQALIFINRAWHLARLQPLTFKKTRPASPKLYTSIGQTPHSQVTVLFGHPHRSFCGVRLR